MARRAIRKGHLAAAGALVAGAIAATELFARWRETVAGASVEGPVMVPVSCAAILLAALALALVCRPRASARVLAIAAATTSSAIGAWMLLHHALVLTRGVALLQGDRWWTRPPGLTTGLVVMLLGAALLTLGSRRKRVLADACALAALVLVLVVLNGHLYDIGLLYGLSRGGGTALTTAAAVSALAVGALFADPGRGLAELALSDSLGGHLLRRLTPAVVLIPILLGWLVVQATRSGYIGFVFGAALLDVSLIVLLGAIVYRQARVLDALEAERRALLRSETRARMEAQRRRLELERVSESRARLIRGFGHDVKNPLGAADAYAWLLERGAAPGAMSEEHQESLKGIRSSIQTSLRLIDELLEVARSEGAGVDIESVPTDLGAAAREVAESFRGQAKSAGLVLEIHARPGIDADTDPERVRQVLSNLLSNAVKYTASGKVGVDVAVTHSGGPRPGGWATICVTDTGPGIPHDQTELIFHEYVRLDAHRQPGAGIGLAISRHIARLLGGDLTVDSAPGHGSTFTLWLPLHADAAAGR